MPNLATVTLPANLTGIPKDAFAGSAQLKTVKFGDASTNNGGDNTGRTVTGAENTITLPTGLTSLGNNAFAGTAATTVDLSKITATGFTTIGENAFRGMASLTTVTLPSGLTQIGNNAFQNDAALTTLSQADPASGGANGQVREGEATAGTAKFGSKLIRIGDAAFQGTGFSTVDLSAATGTTATGTAQATSLSVGSGAFTDMASLTEVKLPANADINPTYFGTTTSATQT